MDLWGNWLLQNDFINTSPLLLCTLCSHRSGDTTPCEVNPVILHGVISPESASLSGAPTPQVYLTESVFEVVLQKSTPPENPSTYPSLLLTWKISWRIFGGFDFCKTTSKTLCEIKVCITVTRTCSGKWGGSSCYWPSPLDKPRAIVHNHQTNRDALGKQTASWLWWQSHVYKVTRHMTRDCVPRLVSQKVLIRLSLNNPARTNPSTHLLLLLIERTSWRICSGIDFCKTTS